MESPRPRPSFGMILSLPVSLALIGAFFLPWIEVSCGAMEAPFAAMNEFGPGPGEILDLPGADEPIATTSGWQLAEGTLEPTGALPVDPEANEGADDAEIPRPRRWVFAGLVLPILMALLSLLGLTGHLTRAGSGKGVAVFALGGLACMVAVWSVDYISDDMVTAMTERMDASGNKPCPVTVKQTEDAISEFIATRHTPWFWATMGAYGFTALLGLGVAAGPGQSRTPTHYHVDTWADAEQPEKYKASSTPLPSGSRARQPSFRTSPAQATGEMRTPAHRCGDERQSDSDLSFGEDL
ncbi:MAG: hypothetical protein KGY99_03090 [Phycisphaerae bacterium]|nr:hypothetical protein [Phycisphaerae bacterium]